MANPKIGVVLGSIRQGRFCDKAADWFLEIARRRSDLAFERIDLRDVALPMFDEPLSPAWGPIATPAAQAWQQTVARLDGFIFVTPEYNHGPSSALKNALDYAYNDWNRKPAGFVGYGSVGAARAVEQLRLVAVELQMAPTRNAVHIAGGDFFAAMQGQTTLGELPYLPPTAEALLDELAWWARTLKSARETQMEPVP
jgi:NAD(P)H-dependent FMN reductase